MCDYSLEANKSRKAALWDALRTKRFGESNSMGLSTREEPDTATCLLEGTRLLIRVTPGMARDFKIPEGQARATFKKRVLRTPATNYRDGVVFDDTDKHQLFQDFDEDVLVEVVRLPEVPVKRVPHLELVTS